MSIQSESELDSDYEQSFNSAMSNSSILDEFEDQKDKIRENITFKWIYFIISFIFTLIMIILLGISLWSRSKNDDCNIFLTNNVTYINTTCVINDKITRSVIVPILSCNRTDLAILSYLDLDLHTSTTTTQSSAQTSYTTDTIFKIWSECWYQDDQVTCNALKSGELWNRNLTLHYQEPYQIQMRVDHTNCLENETSSYNIVLVFSIFLGICLAFAIALLLFLREDYIKLTLISLK
jgi:hypothetical protein